MGQILAIVSSKGGVGKTTTAVNLAAAFASLDFPTLLVEADPQCGIVANFGFDRFDIPRGLAEVARREARADEVTFETSVEGLHVVSSNVWSQAEEAEYLKALEADPLVFREQLASVAAAYDYVVIDAPPMLGPITVAILAAADRFIVPLQTEPQALRSLGRLVETAGQVRDRFNRGLLFDGIALTMVDSRTRLSMQVIEQVQADYPDLAFSNSIPRSVRLSEMAAAGRPLVVAAPASRGARAYAALAEEILLKHARERMIERAGDDDDLDEVELDDTAHGRPAAPAEPGSEPLALSPAAGANAEAWSDEDDTFEDDADGDDDTPRETGDAARGWQAGASSDDFGGGAQRGETADALARAGDAHGESTPADGAGRIEATAGSEGAVATALITPLPLPEPRPVGRIAIASGRIPEQGGDIHKSRRRARGHGAAHAAAHGDALQAGNGAPQAGVIGVAVPGANGTAGGNGAPATGGNGAAAEQGPAQAAGQGHVTLLPPGVSGGLRPGAASSNGSKAAAASKTAPAPVRAPGEAATMPPSLTVPPSLLDDESPDEWNEQNFVDLDTYMQMEAGETAGAVAADEDEWDEEWGQ